MTDHLPNLKEKPELVLICRVNPTSNTIKKIESSIQQTLQASVDYFDFYRASLVIVQNDKPPVCWLAAKENTDNPTANTTGNPQPDRCCQLNNYLSTTDTRESKNLLESLSPVISTNLPVFLQAGDPVGTMEIGIFNTDYQSGQYMLAKAVSLGRHMADIIQESLLQKPKDRHLRKLAVWLEMVNTISSTLDIRQVLHVVAQLTADLFAAKSCIYLLNEDEQSLIPAVAVGSYDPALKRKFKALKGTRYFPGIEEAIKTGQPVIVTPENISRFLTREIINDFAFGWIVLAPIVHKGKTIGVMQVDRPADSSGFDSEETEIIFAIARATAVAMENARLIEMLGQKEQLLHQLVNKMITAQEDERKRLAADLHDGIIQSLIAIWYRLQRISSTEETTLKKWHKEIKDLTNILNEQIQEIRRILYDLRPIILDNYGLIPAVEAHLDNITEKYNLPIDFNIKGEKQRLSPKIEVTLYRILQEALTNVIKHAGASSVNVYLDVQNEYVTLSVKDNGQGIINATTDAAQSQDHLGLASIRERALLLGGICSIDSQPGKGTQINVRIPI